MVQDSYFSEHQFSKMHVSIWLSLQSLRKGTTKQNKTKKLLCDWRAVLSNSPRPSQTILAPVPATAATGNTGRAFGESFLIEVPTSARTWNGAECSISTLIRTALQSLLRTDKVFQSPTSTAQEKTNRPTAQRPACCWAAEQAWLSWELPVQQRKSLASLSALVFFTAEHTLDRRVQTTFFDSDWKNKKKVTLQSYWLQNNQSLFVFLQSLLFFFSLSHQLNNRQMHFHHKTNAIAAPCRCCECLCTVNNWQKIKNNFASMWCHKLGFKWLWIWHCGCTRHCAHYFSETVLCCTGIFFFSGLQRMGSKSSVAVRTAPTETLSGLESVEIETWPRPYISKKNNNTQTKMIGIFFEIKFASK